MKRNLPGDRTLSKASQGESTKRPRGSSSKSDLLKEEVQQDQKTGALTIFGCLKKKDSLDTLSDTKSSGTFKSTEPVATNTSKKDQTLL